MNPAIEAIFLDVGNTLRILLKDEAHQALARRRIAELAQTDEPADAFCERLDARYKIYRKWAFETLIEASEYELWTRFMLPDFPINRIGPRSSELTFQYRQSMGRRVMQRDAREVVLELKRRGYRLGIISNVITAREIPDWLDEDGLSEVFETVVLSSMFGRRKPDPAIYLEAARRAGVEPARCVYVGDNLDRDVSGTRAAGFGMVVILMDEKDRGRQVSTGGDGPDEMIDEFRLLLDLFPERETALETG